MKMKAVVLKDFGGPEFFETREVDVPEPGPRQLLVEVYATAVNPVDYKIRKAGSRYGIDLPAIIGHDVSGVVIKTGSCVSSFVEGDEVYYSPPISNAAGTYAELNVVEEDIVALKPKNISHLEAAGIPLAGGTAWEGLITRGKIGLSETSFIHAGAGGVGSLAIQIAKAAGARVVTTCRAENIDLVRTLGADAAIDYRSENYVEAVKRETAGEGVDLVFDTVGGDTMARCIEITKNFGRMVNIVDTDVSMKGAYRRNITIHLEFSQRNRTKLDHLRSLIEGEKIKPVIDSVLNLDRIAEAHQILERGGVRGKVILQVRG